MSSIDWSAKVKQALERTDIMSLSTVGDDGSWTSPVQYAYNPSMELSFLSKMDTKHVANILKDPRVSLAIYKPEPFPEGHNLGLQIIGIAKHVSEGKNDPDGWQKFVITPKEVWCFDSRISDQRKKIDLKTLKF